MILKQLFLILFSFTLAYGAEDYSFESYKVTHNKKNPYTYVQHLLQSKERWINNDAHREKISTSLFGLLAEAGTKRISNEVESFTRTDVGEYYSNPEKDVLRVLYLIGQKYDETKDLFKLIETSSKKHFDNKDEVKILSRKRVKDSDEKVSYIKATKENINKHWSIVLLALEFGRKNLFKVMDDHFDFSLFGKAYDFLSPEMIEDLSSGDNKQYLAAQQDLWNYIPTITSPSMKEAFEKAYKYFRDADMPAAYSLGVDQLEDIVTMAIPNYSNMAKGFIAKVPPSPHKFRQLKIRLDPSEIHKYDSDLSFDKFKKGMNMLFKEFPIHQFPQMNPLNENNNLNNQNLKNTCEALFDRTKIKDEFLKTRKIPQKAITAAQILENLFASDEGQIWRVLHQLPKNYAKNIEQVVKKFEEYEQSIQKAEEILKLDIAKYSQILAFLKTPNYNNISSAIDIFYNGDDLVPFEAFNIIYKSTEGKFLIDLAVKFKDKNWVEKYNHIKIDAPKDKLAKLHYQSKATEALQYLDPNMPNYDQFKILILNPYEFVPRSIESKDFNVIQALNVLYQTEEGKFTIDNYTRNTLKTENWETYYNSRKTSYENEQDENENNKYAALKVTIQKYLNRWRNEYDKQNKKNHNLESYNSLFKEIYEGLNREKPNMFTTIPHFIRFLFPISRMDNTDNIKESLFQDIKNCLKDLYEKNKEDILNEMISSFNRNVSLTMQINFPKYQLNASLWDYLDQKENYPKFDKIFEIFKNKHVETIKEIQIRQDERNREYENTK